jgi:hypothetical protein
VDQKLHCCLGVLEELAVKKGIIKGYDHWNGSLDTKVMNWAELDSRDPKLGPRRNSRKASWLNDNRETFAQIADRIEKYL